MIVTCAIIIENGRVLVTQRSHHKTRGGKWEFPGGKIHAGETAEACIVRELMEELDVVVQVTSRLEPVSHRYPDLGIELLPLLCHIRDGSLRLIEHIDLKWASLPELDALTLCEADEKLLPQVRRLL